MGYCWYCHWGWSEPVAAIFDRARSRLGGDATPLEFGPGHIVWSDENFDEGCVRWCLDLYDPEKFRAIYPGTTFAEMYENYTAAELQIVRESLEELLTLPAEVRDPCPAEYDEDDDHPEKYPPPTGLVMVKRSLLEG